MDTNKQKALVAALSQIEKQFGKGSIMKLGTAEVNKEIEVVSTGSLGLDLALGIGGLPRGRIVEIYGPESSGKTTLTLQAIAETRPGSLTELSALPGIGARKLELYGVDVLAAVDGELAD